ncbi:hypothetical protein C2G38_179391 [Gigaspora rosea]|uniref:Uncharacterized protein n=1 Tax=Gigaspora rosea TaxID=44941 RepID=A0A397UJW7_9GLOM|nr:hypothetical protein C2G38_179391 [Gigaspora rosea]
MTFHLTLSTRSFWHRKLPNLSIGAHVNLQKLIVVRQNLKGRANNIYFNSFYESSSKKLILLNRHIMSNSQNTNIVVGIFGKYNLRTYVRSKCKYVNRNYNT